MRRLPARILVIAMAILQPGCSAGWHQPSPLEASQLDSRQQVRVWRGGAALRWHAVRVTDDSVSGVPFLSPGSCDSCRASYPRKAVDSIQVGRPVAAFWKTVGLVVAGGLVVVALLCPPKGCHVGD